MAIRILSTLFNAWEGQVAGVSQRSLDEAEFLLVHEGPGVGPWVDVIAMQDLQAVACDEAVTTKAEVAQLV